MTIFRRWGMNRITLMGLAGLFAICLQAQSASGQG